MRKTVTSELVRRLNEARGLKYPDVGYTQWADIHGWGNGKPMLYVCVRGDGPTPTGAVTASPLRGKNARERCAKLRAAIAEALAERARKTNGK